MRRSSLAVLLLVLLPFAAQAASFSISPTRLKLSSDHPTDALKLTNAGDSSTLIQVQVAAWSQEKNGDNVFAATRGLLATPPIFRLAPKADQIIRVGLRAPAAATTETAYRVFLTQVPPAPNGKEPRLNIALRISIPVFIAPKGKPVTALQWHARRLSPTELQVSATNTGNVHVQVHKITLDMPAPRKPVTHEAGNYLLPGTTAVWAFKLNKPIPDDATLELVADTDQGTLHGALSTKD